MRVCLINPPRIHPKGWGNPTVYQPIGIAYVAAVLEDRHKVSIIDAPTEGWRNLVSIDETNCRVGLNNEDIADRIKRWSPDIVGINVPFSGWSKTAFDVASVVKSVDKDIVTVLDGLHPSARPVECLSNPNVDFVVRGEAEYTMLELVGALEQGKTDDLDKIEGIGFTKKGKQVLTVPRPEIQDLDSLPFPARHLLPMDIYFEAVKENPIRGIIRKRYAIMITSRGCPHECIFCSNHIVMGRKWRGRSPENVVEEIEQLVKTYSIKQIDFFDDNMTLIKKRAVKICDLIMERGLDIEWYVPTGVRVDTLDEELLRKMKSSGCKGIRFAPESGVQRVVTEVITQNLDLKDVEKAVVLAKKVGIKTGIFFILGLIGETKEDMEETIKYAYKLRKLGAANFHFSIATPLYGTELYEQAKLGGFLKENFSDEALARAEPLIETPDFTTDEVRELCIRANVVNQTITRDKIVKAIRDPKKAMSILKALLTKPKGEVEAKQEG
ncbi:B12-binding domain-containing radical SAM protein [Candidatus Bathyarchaeota archaeon]|nr:B12-binding domain-containing radical SAM protein [Candidatus Bathyarchaeota archaeon]